jgi:hypothetical protein
MDRTDNDRSPDEDWFQSEKTLGIRSSELAPTAELPPPAEWSPPSGWSLPSEWALPLFAFGPEAWTS